MVNGGGGIDWLCLPAFDAPSFFGALLDQEKGGEFVVRPSAPYRVERQYLDDSAILQTRFVTGDATVLLTDFFVIARRRKSRFYDFTALEPTRKLVRMVELERGECAEVEIRVAARPDYARREGRWTEREDGFECAEAAVFSNPPLQCAADLSTLFPLQRGQRIHIVLDYSTERTAPEDKQIDSWLAVTKAFWEEWNLFNYYRGAHERLVRRSAVTLKLLTHAPTGALVAAPTTSLPEKIGGDANWDYRFTWLRDTSLLINALFRLGYSGEAKAYLEFLEKGCGDNEREGLPVLLPIREKTRVAEQSLEHLAGYRASRPVRIGNRAHDQLQLDNYGHFLQSLLFWKHTGGKIDRPKRRIACDALAAVRRQWREPDHGIWEGTSRRQYSYGKVSAWLALQRGCDVGLLEEVDASSAADEIRGFVLRGVENVLPAELESGDLGTSALLAYTTGFLPEAIARCTREEIERKLFVAPWLYRTVEHREKGEGAFVLCSFWLIDHLLREGEIARAEKLLEKIIAHASPLGLFAEEIDPATGEFLGNFPQAFSHLGLITAILNVEQSKRDRKFARLAEHEKFQRSVGVTIGIRGIVAGFWRVPRAMRLLFRTRSKWKGPV